MDGPNASLPTAIEWTAFKARLERLRDEAFAAAREFYPDPGAMPPDQLSRKAALRLRNSHGMVGLLDAIEKRFTHDNPRDYVAFHVLIGSTITRHHAPKLDLPDGFSVEKFYEAVKKNPRTVYTQKHAPAMIPDGCHE